jgi:lysine 6-dehydrogenase
MSYSYLVLGAGRQGTAAAYDLARFGDAGRVSLADADLARAQSSAQRVNELSGRTTVQALALDAGDGAAVRLALQGYDVALSAVPYYYNLALAQAAIDAGVSFCDLGGNTDIVRRQHTLDAEARAAGVRIVPDCGMGPGMGNTLAVYAMGLLDQPEHVTIYDAGLPQEPQPPWNYLATFNIEGLINEYHGGMTVLQNSALVHLPCFSELETIHVPTVGHLEAFVVAGGVSTAPWTFHGQLQSYQLKVCRYPGTFAQLKAFSDLGLFSPEPVRVGQVEVSPRQVFAALYEPQVRAEVMRDVCFIRAHARGLKNGRPAQAQVDLVDRFDETTGFTAMERTTGWHASIVAAMLARGETPVGSVPLEIAVPGDRFVEEARRRGFNITTQVSFPAVESL